MNISKLSIALGLCAVSGSCIAKEQIKQKKETNKDKPNVVILLTDDQRFSSINELGIEDLHTPTMDKLVRNGVTFTNTHIMGSYSGAVCMPSRAMLFTSKNLFNLQRSGAVIPKEDITMGECLKNSGYNTFGTGKWHNSREAYTRSFTAGANIFFGGMSDHYQVPIYDFDASGKYPKANKTVGKKFSSELFTDAAVDYIENYNDDKPFFMYVAYTAPHDPRMAPKEYTDLYKEKNIKLPGNYLPEHPFDNGELIIRDELLAPFPRTKAVVKKEMAAYYAMISNVDAQMNRVIESLKATGNYENTIIIYAADNGLAVGQHGLMGKQNLYDHSVRVPLVICGPGIPENKKADALCYLSDLYPSICDMINVDIPSSVEGESFAKALQNPKTPVRDAVYFAYKNFQRGVRTPDGWKLIRYLVKGEQRVQLFNINKDPLEKNDLSSKKKYASKIVELTDLMSAKAKECNDTVDFSKEDWGVKASKSWVAPRNRKKKNAFH